MQDMEAELAAGMEEDGDGGDLEDELANAMEEEADEGALSTRISMRASVCMFVLECLFSVCRSDQRDCMG